MATTIAAAAHAADPSAEKVPTRLASGQTTLADLAEAQRLKQQIEIAKTTREAAASDAVTAAAAGSSGAVASQARLASISPAAARDVAQKAADANRPPVVLHALYARGNTWVAELADGRNLALALVGMNLGGFTVTGIDGRGVLLRKPCAAGARRGSSCGERVLRVGEAV